MDPKYLPMTPGNKISLSPSSSVIDRISLHPIGALLLNYPKLQISHPTALITLKYNLIKLTICFINCAVVFGIVSAIISGRVVRAIALEQYSLLKSGKLKEYMYSEQSSPTQILHSIIPHNVNIPTTTSNHPQLVMSKCQSNPSNATSYSLIILP